MTVIQNFRAQLAIPVNPLKEIQWTDVKVQKIRLYALSGAALVGAGIVACTITPVSLASLAAAIPLTLASGALLWYASSLVDYEDPKELLAIREQALKTPLSDLIKKHSLEKIFSHAILDSEAFETSYKAHANNFSFSGIVSLYKKTKETLDSVKPSHSFTIPSPALWKEAFLQETKDLNCKQIVSAYPISDLKSFDMLTPQQLSILEKTHAEMDHIKQTTITLERQFLDLTAEEASLLRAAKTAAKLSYQGHPSHALLRQIEIDADLSIAACRSYTQTCIRLEESSFESFQAQLMRERPHGLTPADVQAIASAEAHKKNVISRLWNNEWSTIADIRNQTAWRKTPLEQARATAKQLRDFSIRQAQERFDLKTMPIRNEINAIHEANRKQHEEKLNQLNAAYQELALLK